MKKILGFSALAASLGLLVVVSQPKATATESAAAKPTVQTATESPADKPAVKMVAARADMATLKATFIYDGTAPKAEKIDGSKDPFCADFEILSESLVVGEKGELKNLAFILDTRRSDIEIPAEFAKAEPATIVLDNKGCEFEPHVMFARPGQTVEVTNSDQTGHNANFNFFNNNPVNFLVPAGGKKSLDLTTDEPAPIPVECNVHPWMKSYLIVQEHPYVGISNEKGELVIENLPPGEMTFRIWHESADGSIEKATINGKEESFRRGRIELELKPGMNDLGTIKISPDMFK